MSIKISELPQATSVTSSDIVPIVQGGTTKQATAGMMSPTIATSITSSSTNDEVAGAKSVFDIINSPSICQITSTNRISCRTPQAWANNVLPLDTLSISSEDYTFSTQNHTITVGSNPRLIEASFNCAIDTLPVANYNFRISVDNNGTGKNYAPTAFKTVSGLDVGNLSNTTIIEVTEGDVISLCYTSNTSGASFYTGADATLTIKTLAYNTNSQVTLRKATFMNNLLEKEQLLEKEAGETKLATEQVEQVKGQVEDIKEAKEVEETIDTNTSGDTK